jgi:hypothetical protein
MNDTSADIAALAHARLMAKSGAERFLMGVRMHEAARRMVLASFPPNISVPERRRLLRERFYGDMTTSVEAPYGST